MKKILSIILVILMITGSFAIAATFDASAEDGWELVWNDEFSGNTLDTTKWENLNTKKSAPRPNESEVQEDNAYVQDGKLIIKNEIGKCEPGSSAKYTTARLMTMDMFKYGKFEIRAKCAEATGTNSAFWTWGFPNDPNYKFHYWPKGQFEWTYGEIDLVERFNAVEWNNANYRTIKSQLHFIGPYKDKSGTVHTNKSEWSKTTYDSVKPGDVKSELSVGQDYGTSWHTFGCEWNADEIKLFRDGIQYGTLDLRFKSDTYPTAADAMDVFREYCQKFIISDWMGSYGPVSGDSTFQIDYFRVWQKPGCLINYNEYGTSAYNSAKKVQTMDTNLATSEEVYYQPELKGNASYTIFDADASSVNYPTAPQGATANSIASKEKRNALRIKRTSQYDNVCIQFPGDYSSVAQKAKYLRMWVACDEGAMYYADQKGGVSYGFRTTDGKYYFANGEKGLNYCSSNVSYFGNYHWVDLSNLKLTETDVNKYDSCGDRLKDVKGGQTTSFSSIAGKIDAVYVNFGVISGMGNATGVNDCYYIDDLEFVNDATVGTTSSTSASTSKSTVTTTTTKSSDTATNVSVYNNSKIKLLGRAFQVGSKYSSGMASANSSVCLPWAGDGIEYSYTSSNKSSLTAKVAVGGSTYGKTSFTLLVDGIENGYYYINSTATDTQFQEYTLTFNNLPSGTHTARLVRRDKNFAAAHTYLKSLSFNGTLNNAPATSNLKIEFIGDSITVGDGLSEAEGNDITKAWAYLTAKGVNAEYSIVGKEGYNTQKILDQNLYKSWSTVANNIDYSPTKKADMVIINLGTNPDNNEDTFYSNAVKLINIVRNIHGSNVKVLWVYNMMTAQYLSKMQLLKTNGYVNGVVELKRDTSGHNGHPTAQGQLESANILINYLKTNYNYNGTTQTVSSTTTTTTTKSPSSSSSSTTTTTKSGQVVSGEKVLNWNSQNNYYCSGTSSKQDGSITVSNASTSSATRIINSWGNNVSAYDGIRFTVTANSGSSSDIQIELGGYETGYKSVKSGSNEFVIDFKECGIDPSAVSDINFYANGAYNFTISDIIGYKNSVAPAPSSSSTTSTTKSTQQDKTVTIDGVKIENDGNEFTLPVSTKDGFVAYFDGTNFYDANTKIALDTDKTFTTVAIGKLQMLKGASIRLGDVSGMRFFTVADPDMLDKLPAGTVVSKGTLITPVDLLGGEELTLDSTCQKLNVLYQSNSYYQNGNTFVGSIVNIKDSNITREFIGRGYITITYGDFTKTIYAESNDNARSIAYIASVYKSDSQSGYSSLSPSLKELVDKWASKYVDANDSNIDFEDNDASMVTLVGTDVSAEIVDKNNSKMLCVKHTKDYDYLGSDKYARIAVDAGSATDITFDAFYEGWSTKEAHYGIEVNGVQYWDQSWDNGKITKVSKNYSVLNETFTELNGKFGVEGASSLKITADNIKSIDAILIRPINYQDGQVVYVDNINIVK